MSIQKWCIPLYRQAIQIQFMFSITNKEFTTKTIIFWRKWQSPPNKTKQIWYYHTYVWFSKIRFLLFLLQINQLPIIQFLEALNPFFEGSGSYPCFKPKVYSFQSPDTQPVMALGPPSTSLTSFLSFDLWGNSPSSLYLNFLIWKRE